LTYSLPTEAKWEYACRAGTVTRFHCGDDPKSLTQVANVAGSEDGYAYTSPVAKFHPNAFGLYDMHGNVYQLCADWYEKDYYANSPSDDPPGPSTGSERINRGSAWCVIPRGCRSARRGHSPPSWGASDLGFRVSRLAD
jgi:formylglycine-generating enzyme required for sulfatase activity